MTDEVLHDIPIEYREKFRAFLDEDSVPDSALRGQMQQYLRTVRLLAPLVKAFSLDTMESLGRAGIELLDAADTDEKRRLAQAAVRYFVEEEQDDEITGVLGLDDDIQIANAVSRAFGREDLIIRTG